MLGYLNKNQIDYVLYHLEHHFVIDKKLRNNIVFLEDANEITRYQNQVIFLLSSGDIDLTRGITINQIPVIFPISKEDCAFKIIDSNIVFQHDFLKSSFYLLSGYQEYNSNDIDKLGRFSYDSSIQSKLSIVHKPIVNYYFEFIIDGLKEYCTINNIPYNSTPIFKNFAFFLTHDIDRVKYFDSNTFLYQAKQILGIAKSELGKVKQIKEFIRVALNLANPFRRKDPYWNFDFLTSIEKQNNIKAAYFFLPKDQKHVDAYYSFKQKRILALFNDLKTKGHELGLHGTARSSADLKALEKNSLDFKAAAKIENIGIRQHRLLWQHPLTAINQDKTQFIYDTTLGFAAHDGFRNSYCHPFKLYDFAEDRMLNYWEIPLNTMDVTLFYYRRLNNEEVLKSIFSTINEVARFNGVYTLLWHNSFFNELELPGITKFYIDLISDIMKLEPESLVGSKIIERYNNILNG